MNKSTEFLPLSIPNLSGNELEYVKETIETEWVSSVGSYVDRFEKEFAEYVGTKHAVAVMNGTAALHISLKLLNVGRGDEVLVPNLTFVAPVNAVLYCDASPVFMDSEWTTLGMDVDKLKQFLEEECDYRDGVCFNKSSGAPIRAIIPMHTLGYPVDMEKLVPLCDRFSIGIIEDATESLGSEFKGKRTGGFGALGCFSFNGNKIMTTGGGGMIVTNDDKMANRAKHLSTTAKTDPVEYAHDEIGYNYRLVNVLAAIGVAQLEQMPQFVETKRNNLKQYADLIKGHPYFDIHEEQAHSQSNYWMYSLVLKDECPHSVRDLVDIFAKNKIQTRPIWKLMNTLPMFKSFQSYRCDVSEDIYNRVLSIPCSTNLKESDLHRVVAVLKNI